MLFESLSQGKIFLIILATGIIIQLFYEVVKIIKIITKQNYALNIVFDITYFISAGIFTGYVFSNIGLIRFYFFLALLSGVLISRYGLGIILAMALKVLYNIFKTLKKRKKPTNDGEAKDKGKEESYKNRSKKNNVRHNELSTCNIKEVKKWRAKTKR